MLKLISRTSTHDNWFETWVSPFDLQVIQPQLIEDFLSVKWGLWFYDVGKWKEDYPKTETKESGIQCLPQTIPQPTSAL